LYTFDEVANLTGFTARALRDGARRRRFEHVQLGKTRLMTWEQVEKLVSQFTVGTPADGAERDELGERRSRRGSILLTLSPTRR
jgi:hypothetical protein